MEEANDSALARKIKKGNRRAFKKLYDRYHEQLYFLARRYLKDQSLAEDAVQDIFLKLWTKRKKLEGPTIKAYLFTVMKNHLIDIIRKQKTNKKVKEGFKKVSEDKHRKNSTEAKVIYDEYHEIVTQAIENLSPARRKVFEMRNFEGLSNAEVAKKNNVSIHTVKTQFYLGSKYVRNYLKKHAGF